jgi:hypothetical protein
MGRNQKPKEPSTPPNKGTQEECFPRKMATHTVIQFRVATYRKNATKSQLPVHEGVWLIAFTYVTETYPKAQDAPLAQDKSVRKGSLQ